MNRKEYMQLLYQRLANLPPEERDAAMLYYEEYFEDGGMGQEEQIMEELGSPESLAAKILAESAIRETQKAQPSPKKGLSVLWVVILGILALPVALPLILAALGIIIGFGAAILALLASVAGLMLGLLVGGAVLFGHAVPLLVFNTALGILTLGASLILLSLGLLILIPLAYLFRAGINALISLAGKLFSAIQGRGSK